MPHAIDDFDRRILALVQQDCAQPAERIAAQVGLSASAVQRRLKNLRESGVIRREVAVVDAKALGHPMTLIALVEQDRESPEHRARLQRWLAAQPAVQQAYFVTGTTDAVLVVVAPDLEAYDRLMSDLQEANPSVKRITTNVSLQTLKSGLAVPADAGA
jgi:DNA-binding Lrp family transcriptional regulator